MFSKNTKNKFHVTNGIKKIKNVLTNLFFLYQKSRTRKPIRKLMNFI